ncbi:cytochrome P450 [Streptomyces zingiberis]|uniref:Cytochrome P450 n=1 Tax=Streptomyces zingiberis TaxID=2053010 RepID=A0ABX1C101_9ACTN|nr:cytochrome P450 [Streptomyces zingiberis]NJQ03600.1 cytochrome P450 [Streptomyces zingiberis]
MAPRFFRQSAPARTPAPTGASARAEAASGAAARPSTDPSPSGSPSGPSPSAAPRPIPTARPSRRADGSRPRFSSDQVGFLEQAADRYGDIFRFRLFGMPVIVLNNPDHIHQVLVGNRHKYDKEVLLYKLVRPVLRNGLITNPGGALYMRQRRMMQPAFRPAVVARFGEGMTDETTRMLDAWGERYRPGEVADLSQEFSELTLHIVTRTLFSAQVGETARRFAAAFTETNDILGRFFRFPFPPLSVPTPAHRRLREAIGRMDACVSEFIEHSTTTRPAEQTDGQTAQAGQDGTSGSPSRGGQDIDLLHLLMNAVDEEDGGSMDLEQLHHEVLNIVVGAYETTTNAMAWTFQVLAEQPEIEARLHEEVDTVLAGRPPTMDDLRSTPYARRVVEETLRMYSPAWQFMRRAREEDTVGGHRIPAGANIYMNSYLLHRRPEYWENPEVFDPDRFTPERSAGRHKHAYMPFGAGERICIGQHFALVELHLVLLTIAQRYRFTRPAGQPPVKPKPLTTLHPGGGVHLEVRPRATGDGGTGLPGADGRAAS